MPTGSNSQLHQQLRALLPSARAETCRVIVTFLDIRSFSTFSAKGDSFDTATYLSAVYSAILTSYFPEVDFFKLTGDGMLLIHNQPVERSQLPHVISTIMRGCNSLVEEFSQVTAGDYMINFPVPQRLGIGIARGSATRLLRANR